MKQSNGKFQQEPSAQIYKEFISRIIYSEGYILQVLQSLKIIIIKYKYIQPHNSFHRVIYGERQSLWYLLTMEETDPRKPVQNMLRAHGVCFSPLLVQGQIYPMRVKKTWVLRPDPSSITEALLENKSHQGKTRPPTPGVIPYQSLLIYFCLPVSSL